MKATLGVAKPHWGGGAIDGISGKTSLSSSVTEEEGVTFGFEGIAAGDVTLQNTRQTRGQDVTMEAIKIASNLTL